MHRCFIARHRHRAVPHINRIILKARAVPSQYDLSVSTFSPDGRVFQTDYAQKAVDNSG